MGDELRGRVGDAVAAAKGAVEVVLGAGEGDSRKTDGEPDREAVRRERVGRTNAARADEAGLGPEPVGWDEAEEHGEGLDDVQGRYAADAWMLEGDDAAETDPPRGDPVPAPLSTPVTPELWDRLAALAGRTVETAKGEPFVVAAVEPGTGVTVTPLDGGQRWVVAAAELEAAWALAEAGEPLDRLLPIRLQEEGIAARHPEYVAGLLRALAARE